MNCKQHENIGKAMAANNYRSFRWKAEFGEKSQNEASDDNKLWISFSTRFVRSFVYLRMNSCLVVGILISDYQKLHITAKQGILAIAKR